MSKRVAITGKNFGCIEVLGFSHIHDTHSNWHVYCNRCRRKSVLNSSSIKSHKHKYCVKCQRTRFDYNESLAIVKYLETHKKIEAQKEFNCSSSSIYTAIKMVTNAEKKKALKLNKDKEED